MSLDLLRRLREVHAFDASPLRHDLGIYHVPFDELAPGQSPEARLAGAARRGERTAVVGRSGVEELRAESAATVGQLGDTPEPIHPRVNR